MKKSDRLCDLNFIIYLVSYDERAIFKKHEQICEL